MKQRILLSVMAAALVLQNGIYRDKAPGYGGEVIVKAIVRDGKLTEITTENTGGEKSEYYQKAEEALIPRILEQQGVEGVDTVSGATGTSESILSAMRGILEQAVYTSSAVSSVKEATLTPTPHQTI
jgi:uncharacterized protein with FMN-binding domain